MSLLDLARLLLRRWPVVILVGLLTGAGAALAFTSAEPTYTVETSLILETVQEGGDQLVATSTAVAQALSSGEVRSDIASLGGITDYETSADGDFVLIRATSTNEASARRTVEVVLERLDRDLPVVAQQYGIRGAESIRAEVVATPGVRGETPDGATIVEAAVLVVDPPQPPNPFANGDYAAQVLLAAAESRVASGAFDIEEPDEIDLTSDYRLPAPVVEMEITSAGRTEAQRLYEEMLTLLRADLEDLQSEAGIAPSRHTQLRALNPDPEPERTPASPLRPVIAIVVLGGVLAVLLALAVDAFVERRAAWDPPDPPPSAGGTSDGTGSMSADGSAPSAQVPGGG